MITYLDSRANPEIHSLDMNIQFNAMNVVVGAGSFVLSGQEYTLTDDYSYDVPSTDHRHFVMGVLAKEKASGDVVLLVKDVVKGGGNLLEFDRSLYEILVMVFTVNVLDGATNLEDMDIKIVRYIPPPPPEEEGGE